MDSTKLDFDSFLHGDHAQRHRSTAGTQPAYDGAHVDRLAADIARDGYAIVERVAPPSLLDEIRADVMPRFVHRRGRNNFEGFATQRLYTVMAKTLVCNPLVEHPLVLGILDRLLDPNYLLSQLQVINILPGEAAQPLHFDDGIYPFARPRRPLGAAAIWAIDDFTADNGATVVIPRSHEWDDRRPTDGDAVRSVVMPAGSVVVFVGTLWHGGGANRSTAARLGVAAQYCAPFLRQQETLTLGIPRAQVARCSEHVQRLVGYSIHPPFMGFVDGQHPKRLLGDT
jgi:hypothetical protein